MIWNDEYLFLHYPKAAGKSLTEAFLRSWRTPVRAYLSRGQMLELGLLIKHGSSLWIKGSHQNATEAARILDGFGLKLESFRAIFLAVRCPYDLIFSTYKFQRQWASTIGTRGDFSLAGNSNFVEFAAKFQPPDYCSWFQLQNKDLANLRIIRFEKIAHDFKKHASEFGFRNVRIPHLNASGGESLESAMTPDIEEIVYAKYRFLFDRGYYSRLTSTPRVASKK